MIQRRREPNGLPVAEEAEIRQRTGRITLQEEKAKVRPHWQWQIPQIKSRRRIVGEELQLIMERNR